MQSKWGTGAGATGINVGTKTRQGERKQESKHDIEGGNNKKIK